MGWIGKLGPGRTAEQTAQLTIRSGWAARNAARENMLSGLELKRGYAKSIGEIGFVNDGEGGRREKSDLGRRSVEELHRRKRMTLQVTWTPRPAMSPSVSL